MTLVSTLCITLRYISSLYWSVTTMATVGYGDLVPVNKHEKVIAMFGMLLGATMISYLMGAMANVISTMNTVSSRQSQKRQVRLCPAARDNVGGGRPCNRTLPPGVAGILGFLGLRGWIGVAT